MAKIYRYFQKTDDIIEISVLEELNSPADPKLIDSSATQYMPITEDDWLGPMVNF